VQFELQISLDKPTKNRIFGHYVRILIVVDLNNLLHESVLVEREGFVFYVGVIYGAIFEQALG
jgi:hypothetical protein